MEESTSSATPPAAAYAPCSRTVNDATIYIGQKGMQYLFNGFCFWRGSLLDCVEYNAVHLKPSETFQSVGLQL